MQSRIVAHESGEWDPFCTPEVSSLHEDSSSYPQHFTMQTELFKPLQAGDVYERFGYAAIGSTRSAFSKTGTDRERNGGIDYNETFDHDAVDATCSTSKETDQEMNGEEDDYENFGDDAVDATCSTSKETDQEKNGEEHRLPPKFWGSKCPSKPNPGGTKKLLNEKVWDDAPDDEKWDPNRCSKHQEKKKKFYPQFWGQRPGFWIPGKKAKLICGHHGRGLFENPEPYDDDHFERVVERQEGRSRSNAPF
ncbi:hypothetical protein TNIN_233601 [Trichonephila inaurata madagascariensis]|uniref:Uncharacterized protein n=1 Tax=Trichonephila inaurata madagascariensis TaxID=2747483 RepID=A0A8X6WRR7_9ARAC|nr:hypothetical protein TNIN_233601 [Trichonephila inaurata madagascariensis]